MLRRSGTTLALAMTLALLPAGAALAEEVPDTEPTPSATPEPESTPEPSATPTSTASAPVAPAAEPTATPTPTPTVTEPTEEPEAGAYEVDSAQLRWGLNVESNGRAFAPRTVNLFSAGRLADPGSGGNTLTTASQGASWSNGRPAGWSAESGDVSLEKWNGSSYQPATFAGTQTDQNGAALGFAGSGSTSGHQVVLDGGTGEIDTVAGDATISWDGDFTVAYYSGMSFFHVSDPTLTVTRGQGTLTATLGGYASSMEDQSRWVAVPERTVTIATLPSVAIAPGGKGFTTTPAYRGVAVTTSDGSQVRTGSDWGSFPQSFVDFQRSAGSGSYWYSSGGAADPHKVALPVTVSYDQGDPITPPAPAPTPGTGTPVTNETIQPPSVVTRTVTVTSPVVATAPVPVAAPGAALAAPAGTPFVQAASTTTTTADQIAAQTAEALWWWIGIALLTLAAGSVAGTCALSAAASRR